MGKFVPKEIKKLSEQIIKSFSYKPSKTKQEKFNELGEFKRKKQVIKLIEYCKEIPNLTFLESRFNNSNKCQVIWGEWSLLLKQKNIDDNDYDKIGFDLVFDIPGNQYYKFFYISLSKHALERLLERGDRELKNSFEMREFLDSLIKPIVLRSFEIWNSNKQNTKAEDYVIIDDIYLPIVMERVINKYGKTSRVFTIKTFMPLSYKKNLAEQNDTKKRIFDYENLLISKV